MFCCATLRDIDPKQGSLRVWNGGLPDGYLIGADGRRTALVSRHLPLGVVPPAALDDKFEHYPLAPGDRLLLLSDGVVESRNANDELFGEQHLTDTLDRQDDQARPFDEYAQGRLDRTERGGEGQWGGSTG